MQPPKSNHPPHLRIVEGPRKRKYPPELADVSDQELVAMCFAGIELVERVMKNVDPWEIVNTCFVQLCDTYRWNPKRGTLRDHFLLLVKNELHAVRKARRKNARMREAELAEGYYRETYQSPAPSPEEVAVADEQQRVYDHNASRRRVLLERVRQRVVGTPAQALFEYWANATEDLAMTEVAVKLGVNVHQLYAAKKMIEYHALICRKEMEGE
jgi:hypothetical protein